MRVESDVSPNFRLLPWIYAMSGGSLLTAVIVPFLHLHELTLRDVFLLQGIFATTLLIGEIPTGYLSDRWGRRNTTILASFLRFGGMLLYFLGGNFWGFAAGEVLLALGTNCYSGTLDALTYDSLAQIGKEDRFRKLIGHYRSLFFGAEAATNVLGGLIAAINLRAPVGATLITYAVAILLSLLVVEPTRHRAKEEQSITDLWRICRETFLSPSLRAITLVYGILATLGLTLFWFTQPYQGMIGLPLAFFGIAHAIIVGSGAIASRYAYKMEGYFDDVFALMLIATAMTVSVIALGFVTALWGLVFFLIVRVGWSLLAPVTNDLCNRLVAAKDRATVLSIKAFSQRLLFAIASPFLGYLTDVFTLNQAILFSGLLGGFAAAAALVLLHRVASSIPDA
jgi:MFS family permease